MYDSESTFRSRLASIAAIMALAMVALPPHPSSAQHADAVCFPVRGTGFIRSHGLQIPVGSLSPMVSGDTLVVRTGKITLVDFRTGSRSVLAAGSEFPLASMDHPKPPSWYQRLAEYVAMGMSPPARERVKAQSRGIRAHRNAAHKGEPENPTRASLWPDSVGFAPDVPIVLEWNCGSQVAYLLTVSGPGDTLKQPVDVAMRRMGAWALPASFSNVPGSYRWVLSDEAGPELQSGVFEVLSTESAANLRTRYLKLAREKDAGGSIEFSAAVLATAARLVLW